MVSTALASTLARRNIHYGWVVVGATFLTMLVTAGAMGAPGVLIKPLQDEFGWSTSSISSALAIRLVLFGLMGPFAAAFMNRFGVRNVIIFALATDRHRLHRLAVHDAALAAAAVLGRRRRLRHRPDRDGARRHGLDPLVHQASRPRRRHAVGQLGHRPAGLPAADGGADRALWLARHRRLRLRPCSLSPRSSCSA